MKKLIITRGYKQSVENIRSILPLSLALFISSMGPAHALSLDEQRTQYEKATAANDRNDQASFKQLKAQLKDYPLYPYLEYREFVSELNDATPQQVNNFVARYDALPFTDTIRARFLNVLATRGEWKQLLAFQPTVPRGESYQCNYYYAHSKAGDKALAMSGAKSLYLSGSSVDKACDKLFDELDRQGKLTDQLVLDRMLLAFEKRNKSLMRYLEKQLDGNKAKATAKAVIALYDDPDGVADFSKKSKVTAFNKKLTRIAFERLASQDTSAAITHFQRTVEGQHYSKAERQEIADYLASKVMGTDDADKATWRDTWLATTDNQSLLERRFRVSLTAADWQDMAHWLSKMSDQEKSTLKWRYWQARIVAQSGDTKRANQLFEAVLGERNFYSVAAAEHLNKPIRFDYDTTSFSPEVIAPFSVTLERVEELLALDKTTAAKREWYHLMQRSNEEQKAMLAAYASDKNWYHFAVQATISGKLWGHLENRFPIAHRWWFEFFSKERELPLTTLLALSRQESAFYTRAVSPVGARGLMQLMPATARETSKKLGFRYLGKNTLHDPGVNIRLGSGYLRMLLDSFEQNRILALAGYNAGPHRATTWLSRTDGKLDAIGFIEAIPFNETRRYVQNVLMYDIYYRKLLGQPLAFLTDSEAERRY